MLSEIEVLSSQGSNLIMPLDDVSDGIVVINVDGLDPVKATIVTTNSPNQDGTQYHTSVREDRNLKLTLEMQPDEVMQSVSSVRNKLYEFFMPKEAVKFTFRTEEGLEVEIFGRVESFENAHFVAEPAVDISILCFDPDFVDPDVIEVPGATVNDASTFNIVYPGTVETSIVFDMTVDRDLPEFTIYSTLPDGTDRNLAFAVPLEDGDRLVIDTTPGAKAITQYRSGAIFANPLYGMSPQSSWTELRRGTNVFRVYATGAPIDFLISYHNRYGAL